MKSLRERFLENPQELVDQEVILQFNEVEGDVKLVDGVAAGGPWMVFKFETGPYAGKTIACTDDNFGEDGYGLTGLSFTYLANVSDDGMLFNKDPERFDPETDDDCGGDYIPELDQMTLTVKD
jgi:hypothetical protein